MLLFLCCLLLPVNGDGTLINKIFFYFFYLLPKCFVYLFVWDFTMHNWTSHIWTVYIVHDIRYYLIMAYTSESTYFLCSRLVLCNLCPQTSFFIIIIIIWLYQNINYDWLNVLKSWFVWISELLFPVKLS